MQKALDISVSVGDLQGTLLGAGNYDEFRIAEDGGPVGDLYLQQHNHTYYELHYVLSGSCVLQSGLSSYVLGAGHMFLLSPGVYHHFESAERGTKKIDVAFELVPPATKEARNVFRCFPERACMDLDLTVPECQILSNALLYMGNVLHEKREETFMGRERLRAAGNLLLVELYGMLKGESDVAVESSIFVDSRVLKIESFIAKHYNDGDTCDELAKLLHVSQRQLTRIIRQLYNMSFRDKVNEMRLQNALDLLTNTELTVSEISERLGYSSPSNFTIFIKKQTGKTPTQIRSRK